MIIPIFMVITTAPQSQPEDVPAERWQDAVCSDVCCVFFLFMIIFGISMIIFVVICILQRGSTIIQMFEFTTCQYHGDIFNGPIYGGNNGGARNQNTSVT
ncbi:hypothetical protein PTI98_012068 [Pleurotus ostreatus]|nr:hypothetical protein PTI98_012068 [Pleurotus ostreatus]